MKLEFYDMVFSILFPILFGIMAIFFLAIGLRGILTKRPFLVSNRWWLSIMSVVFIPIILQPFLFSFPRNFNSINFINWLNPLLFGFILLVMWYRMKGYVAYAVTDTSFREALLAALQKLQLSYEESLSVIRLTSVEADLQVSVQSWMGTGQIKIKQRTHRSLLREVVNAMNEYFRMSSVPTDMISCVFFVVMGGFMVIFAIGMLFFRNIF